jgi:MoxR-like ATPase
MESVQPIDAATAAAARAASRDERPEATRTIEGIADEFRRHGYIAERSLATTVFLALELGRPLLLEGEAGVGKTELAKVLATTLGTRLIRLQCYEGLDVNTAVYEWNYPRQMLEIRLLEARGEIDRASAHDIFSSEFLLKRPLLQALEADDGPPPVLLIDEIDRADEEFEAYLLEILSDFQVTVPEIGTIRANRPTRSSAAACTTGSTTRRRPRSSRSSRPGSPMRPRGSRARSSRSSTGCGPPTSPRSRASRRRSTGRRRSCLSGQPS